MKFELWNNKWYKKILDDFKFSKDDDEESAIVLNEILEKRDSYDFKRFKNHVREISDEKTNFIVFGAGPSLKKHVKFFKNNLNSYGENIEKSKSMKDNYVIIAADGATTALLEEDIIPNIVVTDLDGKMNDLMLANDLGSFFIVHAHGHNLDKIAKYVPKLKKVLGTTQSKPIAKVHNFGGFTDGDRAVFLAVELKANKIVLGGMDFGKLVTSYSRPEIESDVEIADEIKQKKLIYAEQLIKWIDENEDVDIEFME